MSEKQEHGAAPPEVFPPGRPRLVRPDLPREGRIEITGAEADEKAVVVSYRMRRTDARGHVRETTGKVRVPRDGLPPGPVDAVEAALVDAIRADLAPADGTPAAEESALDSALVRLTERRVIGLA